MNQARRLLVYALRYALPRSTYALDDVLEVLDSEIENLHEGDLYVIMRDLKEAITEESCAEHYRYSVGESLRKCQARWNEICEDPFE